MRLKDTEEIYGDSHSVNPKVDFQPRNAKLRRYTSHTRIAGSRDAFLDVTDVVSTRRNSVAVIAGRHISSFFRSSDMLGVFVSAVTVQRGADTEKKLKRVPEIVSVIAIEMIRSIVERELRAESDVEAVAVR
jgi:hypothetical protein